MINLKVELSIIIKPTELLCNCNFCEFNIIYMLFVKLIMINEK